MDSPRGCCICQIDAMGNRCVMSKDTTIDYGNLTKRIVFTENDHRHAQLILRLRHDSFTQAAFFREIITGYISGDERIVSYVATAERTPSRGRPRPLRTTTSRYF